ncbi:hypothetical protein SASPL_142211 [Salvia splendens]|uniref:Uncharacterized protein n=1 Tax=Salvia splendens TaxID=180675 RepID=A0A8X8Z977_SALSN|nr:hypothetical protein SASPL_142211 [Salvia splendens]
MLPNVGLLTLCGFVIIYEWVYMNSPVFVGKLCLHRGQVSLCLSRVSIPSAWTQWLQSEIVARCSPTSYSLRQMGQPPSVPSSLVQVSTTIPAALGCVTGGTETELVPTKQNKK